jgi:hypothetical protein
MVFARNTPPRAGEDPPGVGEAETEIEGSKGRAR